MRVFSEQVMTLALRGVTVIATAGNSGVSGSYCWCASSDGGSSGGRKDDDNDDGDDDYYIHRKKTGFYPMFPATVPFLTSVGGAQAIEDSSGSVYTVSCQSDRGSMITTGGGFSSYFSAPEYNFLLYTYHYYLRRLL
jgi:subtilase family serine protease